MTPRASVIRSANAAVDVLPTRMRTNSRNGAGHPIAIDDTSILERTAAPAAQASPAAVRINPSCR
jgi:hypothetical protein